MTERTYVTEVDVLAEPRELQILRSPKPARGIDEPKCETGAAEAGRPRGPRPDQNPERNRSMTASQTTQWTRAELDAATAATAAAIADPAVGPAGIYRVAEVEEAMFLAAPEEADVIAADEARAEAEAGL